MRALFGDQMGDVADEIGERLEPALGYVQRTPLARFDVDLRWNGYGRARAATRAVDELILAEVARRRSEGIDATASPDTLSALLVAVEDADGGDAALDDAELCDQIRSLIAAGYDTTSAAVGWMVHALGSNPSALAALRTQVRDAIGDQAPTVDDLRAMPLVDGVVRETLRLWPPAAVSGRTAIDDFEVLGQRIAGGSTVLYSPYVTHRMPEVWGDPVRFRPERWADGEPVPYSTCPLAAAPGSASASPWPPSSCRSWRSVWHSGSPGSSTVRRPVAPASPPSPPKTASRSPSSSSSWSDPLLVEAFRDVRTRREPCAHPPAGRQVSRAR